MKRKLVALMGLAALTFAALAFAATSQACEKISAQISDEPASASVALHLMSPLG